LISRNELYFWVGSIGPIASTTTLMPSDRPVYRSRAPDPDMSDSDEPSVSLASSIGALAVTFLLVTPVAGTLLGFNWTQAVLIGGFAGSVSVASAWLTARRTDGD
jgi:hypothetical protein